MIELEDTYPLTDFIRNTKAQIRQLKRRGRPALLTVNGKASLIVLSAAAFEELSRELERLETIEALADGLASVRKGQGRALEKVMEELQKKHGISEAT